jgi:chemosensory pili system protein ChpA (sensor histidine kinase/response regulator)
MDNALEASDLSALAWVQGELRRSLETAVKALKRSLKETELAAQSDLDSADPAVLRTARTQIHQGVGALELVALPEAASVLRAAEAAVQKMLAKPVLVTAAAVETIEKLSFALLDYLARQLAGKPVSPVMLFPQYRAAQQLAGAERIHPADLWPLAMQWHELPADDAAAPRPADDSARADLETLTLMLMRGGDRSAVGHMSNVCADIAAGAGELAGRPRLATLWQLAAAMFEAEHQGLLANDVYSKRMAARLLTQMRAQQRTPAGGEPEAPERLALDLLFFCAHAQVPPPGQPAPRLAAVRAAWQLERWPTADYEIARLGRHDPAVLALARKRVAGAKEAWSAVAGGELHRLPGLPEQFALVADSVRRLLPGGEALADAVQGAVAQVVASNNEPPAALAMEVATSVLYLDATLEDGELDHPALGDRVQRLAERIDGVRRGGEPQPLDIWMEELYRRVSDRQTMGSVVQELRTSLSEVEKQIDHYFRNPAERQVLIPVPAQLSAMRGVLSVLGMDQASQAVLHMRDDVDALAQTEVDPQRAIAAGTFDRLADNLGALSFLIDMISVQPQLAKSLFRFDAAAGTLSAVMGQSERPSAFADLDAVPAAPAEAEPPVAPELRVDFADTQPEAERTLPMPLPDDGSPPLGAAESTLPRVEPLTLDFSMAPAAAPAPLVSAAPPAAAPAVAPEPSSGLEDDAEMREIFIEEAREVVAEAAASLERLADDADNATEITAVRRAFHTLKGSSRMVGLREFGEAAWACEQLYNARLASAPRADPVLRQFSHEALDYLGGWVEAIADGTPRGHRAAALASAADRLRLEGVRVPIEPLPATAAPPPEVATPAETVESVAAVELVEAPVPVGTLDEFVAIEPVESVEAIETIDTIRTAEPGEVLEPAVPEPLPTIEPIELPVLAQPLDELDAVTAQSVALPLMTDELAPPQSWTTEREALADADAATQPRVALPWAELPEVEPEPTPGEVEATVPIPESIELPLDELPLDAPLDLPSLEATADVVPEAPEAPAGLAAELPVADAPAQQAEPDFELDFGIELESAPAAAAGAEPPSLVERVPDLPSADDLDLSWLAPAAEPQPLADESLEPAAPPSMAEPLPDFKLDLAALDGTEPAPPAAENEPEVESVAESVAEQVAQQVAEPQATSEDDIGLDEQVKVIGPLRIGIPLFNIYLNEADEQSRRLVTALSEWSLERERHPVPSDTVALAHSLAGNSGTVGFADLSVLARTLEHALMRSRAIGHAGAGEAELFGDAAEEIRCLLHQFAAGFLRPVVDGLMERFSEHERHTADQVPLARTLEDLLQDEDDELPTAFDDLPEEVLAEGPVPVDVAEVVVEPEPLPEPEPEPEPEPQPEPQPAVAVALPWLAGAAAVVASATAFEASTAPDEAAPRLGARADAFDDDEDLDVDDALDAELFPIFEEEADELLPQLQQRLREWLERPSDPAAPAACMRTLHTFKGGARLAGAMRLGELAHRLETAVEHLGQREQPAVAADVEPLLGRADRIAAVYESLKRGGPAAPVQPAAPVEEWAPGPAEAASVEPAEPAHTPAETTFALTPESLPDAFEPTPVQAMAVAAAAPSEVPSTPAFPPRIDWGRFLEGDVAPPAAPERAAASSAAVRVRSTLLDRMVNQAGEVSITRARIETEMRGLQGSLGELTDSLDRMRRQLRDIELQAETQMSSRLEAAKAAALSFDPLEMDRFTRFQELTRFMAESVNDVATLQRSLQRTLQSAEDQLAAQARLTRELQDDLLRTRMVEFESLSDRLYRTVRQAAKETAKPVRLDIVGGAIEIDRGVLERMTGPFEHLLRNAVVHGIEPPEGRRAAGKEDSGRIVIAVTQAGNEVSVEFGDDGAGLNLERIRQRGLERGLLAAGHEAGDAELAQLIFAPGFSTAETVTELAGRGVGMDVVRSEVVAMGGRVETATAPGQGTRFRLLLPLTTAVTQVVMLRCGALEVAVPSTLVEIVRRVPVAEIEAGYAGGSVRYGGQDLPFFWLAALLDEGSPRGEGAGGTSRTQTIVVIRSADQRVAVHVDEVLGNQEVVVKNVGPQLARLPGLAGVTLLPSGAVALIYNPVALATLYAERARRRMAGALALPPTMGAEAGAAVPLRAQPGAAVVPKAPLVMVVDDSLTVRRVTQRLLLREGYRVVLAKDGLEALERLAEERPVVVLSDIEMPRMDGFDLLRNIRAEGRLAGMPVVMITSRTAEKHREYATQLGCNAYLGKPYSEDELLGLVAGFAAAAAGAPALPASADIEL